MLDNKLFQKLRLFTTSVELKFANSISDILINCRIYLFLLTINWAHLKFNFGTGTYFVE